MEIGKKKVTKDGTVVDLWGTYGKRFTNGHKTFTSSEVKAVLELQHNEELFRSNFAKYQKSMVRPRDPLAGDATPRNPNGEPIMNVRLLRADKGTTGHLLLPDNAPPGREWVPPVNVTGQIGIPEGKYEILGNKELGGIKNGDAQPVNLFKKTQEEYMRKMSTKSDEERLQRMKLQVKMERQQAMIQKQMNKMTLELQRKEEALGTLKRTMLGNAGKTMQ